LLKPGRDGPVRGGNPWVFSQAIARVEPPTLGPGDGVTLHDVEGATLGFGYYHPNATIAVRLLAFDDAAAPERIVEHRVAQALAFRRRIIPDDTNCYRLINGDGDGLSGIVVDRYDDVAVIQLLTAGAERLREELIVAIDAHVRARAIVEQSQGAVRRQEGLADQTGVVKGDAVTEITVSENGIGLVVDLERGQKTGYFLDQRPNRMRMKALAPGARVLDAYCYAGGFALAALAGGAREVVAVDSSAKALDWARRNLALANCDDTRCTLVHGDAAKLLAAVEPGFDVVVLDPPPLARSGKDAVRAGRLYVELNALAMRAVAPGGALMTFSCSTHFTGDDFVRAVRIAQDPARRRFRLVERLGAGADHPALLGHPEGEYLTGVLLMDLG
jgi:23S rRNA (cytosine1962-C5)-methyltransferase